MSALAQNNTPSVRVRRPAVAVAVGRSATSNNFSNGSPTETLSKLRRGKLSPACEGGRWPARAGGLPIFLLPTAGAKSVEGSERAREQMFLVGTDHISPCRTCVGAGVIRNWMVGALESISLLDLEVLWKRKINFVSVGLSIMYAALPESI